MVGYAHHVDPSQRIPRFRIYATQEANEPACRGLAQALYERVTVVNTPGQIGGYENGAAAKYRVIVEQLLIKRGDPRGFCGAPIAAQIIEDEQRRLAGPFNGPVILAIILTVGMPDF